MEKIGLYACFYNTFESAYFDWWGQAGLLIKLSLTLFEIFPAVI